MSPAAKLIGLRYRSAHATLVAGSRSGKGRSIIVPNLLGGYQGSALVVDPKGELANLTATFRAALGQRVAVLDPFQHHPPCQLALLPGDLEPDDLAPASEARPWSRMPG